MLLINEERMAYINIYNVVTIIKRYEVKICDLYKTLFNRILDSKNVY